MWVPAVTDGRDLGALILSIDEYAVWPNCQSRHEISCAHRGTTDRGQIDAPPGNHLAEIDLAHPCRTHEDAAPTRHAALTRRSPSCATHGRFPKASSLSSAPPAPC